MNKMRARWAEAALEQHQKRLHEQKTTKGDMVAELICNLNHWSDVNGVDFSEALENAGRLYEEETTTITSSNAKRVQPPAAKKRRNRNVRKASHSAK